ncbi:MAG: hypothetical protein ACYCZY_02800 [Lacisediminihabitans sp.]
MGLFDGLFGRKKATGPQARAASVEPVSAAPTAAPSAVDTMVHVKGVGGYQSLLAGPVRRAPVELMAWEKGDAITAKLNGQRVGEIDYSPDVHVALLAMRHYGLPPFVANGEIRKGDYVPRYLAVDLPTVAQLKTLLPKGWAPAESSVSIHMTTRYQEALGALYDEKAKMREAQVSFRTCEKGKYKGESEGVIDLDGQTVGELSAGNDGKWAIIREDRETGVPGQLMVKIWAGAAKDGTTKYTVEAMYRRQWAGAPAGG